LTRTLLAFTAIVLALSLVYSDDAGAGSPASDGGTVFGTGLEPVGCTSTPGKEAREGSRSAREVALTFDDGPSSVQTPEILATLERLDAQATFFEEGRHVAGHEALMREILAAGDEIGNHSYHHPVDPGVAELASTNVAIRAATGFEPCLFRPPYGEIDPKVKAAALANGLETVLWTLDSEDDHHPGVGAIRVKVVRHAAAGSIVLLHDGGHHPETVQALPGLIEGLLARGFRLVTITELLGGRMLYRH
jgi:peptidoglycan-N-acetylglucosamine deacetylase